jgi:uncharacterized protein (TIGR01777 family)
MKIVVAGGTGFIGRPLCESLALKGHQVTVLSRFPREAQSVLGPSITIVGWDGLTFGAMERVLEGTDALINLAGEPIAEERWTDARKQLLRDSRISTTRHLVHTLSRVTNRPRTLINASGIGYYGARETGLLTEDSRAGSGFLADLCVGWEDGDGTGERRRGSSPNAPPVPFLPGRPGGARKPMGLLDSPL